MSEGLIRAVGFDLYGVMTRTPFEPLEAHGAALGLAPGSLSAPFNSPRWLDDVQLGRLAREDFVDELADQIRAAHGVEIDEPLVIEILERSLDAVPEMVDLVAEVGRTCRTGLLTNNIRRSMFWARGLPDDLFDVIVDPDSIGLRKPDRRVYAALTDALEAPPEEVVFIDDSARNLPPARDVGLKTIHFETASGCRQALRQAGVALAA
jgi:epoxide hydrolase-like predicted phosphatase